MTLSSELASSHPPGHLGPASALRLLLGMFGAPAAWTLQIVLSEPLAARACYPNQAPLSEPSWEGWSAVMPVVSLACLAFALLSGLAALVAWRRQARRRSPAATNPCGCAGEESVFYQGSV